MCFVILDKVNLITPLTMYIVDGLAEVLNCVKGRVVVSHLFRFDIHRDGTLRLWHMMSFHSQANFPKLESLLEERLEEIFSISKIMHRRWFEHAPTTALRGLPLRNHGWKLAADMNCRVKVWRK